MNNADVLWNDLPREAFEYDAKLLNLRWSLACGQAFRWQQDKEGWWIGVVDGAALRIRSDGDLFTYSAYPKLPHPNFWESYLRLDFDLAKLYEELGAEDPYLMESFERWPGLRLLRQDPQETVISYLCTTANSIPRISRAIEGMSHRWGRHIAHLNGVDYHAFPPMDALTHDAIPELERNCNLGYRALNLVRAVEEISAKPDNWAMSLRDLPYKTAREELISVRGIGPKIADCVCLFALNKDNAVPVDTHVWQISVDLYLTDIKAKSLTANTYNRIADFYRERFGERAGWAQEYLFFSHLMKHQEMPLV